MEAKHNIAFLEIKDVKNYNTLLKVMREINKWREILCSHIRRQYC